MSRRTGHQKIRRRHAKKWTDAEGPDAIRGLIAAKKSPLAAREAPGYEWWEWVAG